MSCIGHNVTLTCKSDAFPIPTLTWFKPDGTNFNVVKATESTVLLTMNSSVDFGLYNCTADNGFGLACKTVYVGQIGLLFNNVTFLLATTFNTQRFLYSSNSTFGKRLF